MRIEDRRIGEVHGELTIIGTSIMPSKSYIPYYWCKCSCGYVKRYRYDQLRKKGNCGMCEDFIKSEVLLKI